jgi:hypothetical protein
VLKFGHPDWSVRVCDSCFSVCGLITWNEAWHILSRNLLADRPSSVSLRSPYCALLWTINSFLLFSETYAMQSGRYLLKFRYEVMKFIKAQCKYSSYPARSYECRVSDHYICRQAILNKHFIILVELRLLWAWHAPHIGVTISTFVISCYISATRGPYAS